jgi:hypothetical protein
MLLQPLVADAHVNNAAASHPLNAVGRRRSLLALFDTVAIGSGRGIRKGHAAARSMSRANWASNRSNPVSATQAGFGSRCANLGGWGRMPPDHEVRTLQIWGIAALCAHAANATLLGNRCALPQPPRCLSPRPRRTGELLGSARPEGHAKPLKPYDPTCLRKPPIFCEWFTLRRRNSDAFMRQ